MIETEAIPGAAETASYVFGLLYYYIVMSVVRWLVSYLCICKGLWRGEINIDDIENRVSQLISRQYYFTATRKWGRMLTTGYSPEAREMVASGV